MKPLKFAIILSSATFIFYLMLKLLGIPVPAQTETYAIYSLALAIGAFVRLKLYKPK